jgi:hypothetical protein
MRRELETGSWGKLVVELSRLCSYNGFGSFEVMPFRKLKMNLSQLANDYIRSGYVIRCRNTDFCCFDIGDVEVTLYKCGRIILEQVDPNDFSHAARLCMQVYNPQYFRQDSPVVD